MRDYKNLFSLAGKTAVVTGGAGLLGKEIVKALADCGARVVVADINLEKASEIANVIGENACAEKLDIISEASVNDIISKYETIDIWINNAYPRTKDWGANFEETSFDSFRKNVDMHLNGYFLCCQKISLKMKKQKYGSIINMASIYGIVGPNFNIYEGTQMTTPAAYTAIKGGIVNLTRYLASLLGPYNIRANALCPGGVYDNQPEKFVKAYERNTPMKRMACPDDIAGPVVFLASDASKYITGQVLAVDGGWSVI